MKLPKSLTTVTPFSKFIALVLLVLLPFLGFYFGLQYSRKMGELSDVQKDRSYLKDTDGSEKTSSNELPSRLSSVFIERYKDVGLTNPISDIKSDLKDHPELIPYDGTLGGTMGFYSEDTIHVLNEKWVLAYFEDGHIGGQMLLEYTVDQNGNIFWEVIDSYIH